MKKKVKASLFMFLVFVYTFYSYICDEFWSIIVNDEVFYVFLLYFD